MSKPKLILLNREEVAEKASNELYTFSLYRDYSGPEALVLHCTLGDVNSIKANITQGVTEFLYTEADDAAIIKAMQGKLSCYEVPAKIRMSETSFRNMDDARYCYKNLGERNLDYFHLINVSMDPNENGNYVITHPTNYCGYLHTASYG